MIDNDGYKMYHYKSFTDLIFVIENNKFNWYNLKTMCDLEGKYKDAKGTIFTKEKNKVWNFTTGDYTREINYFKDRSKAFNWTYTTNNNIMNKLNALRKQEDEVKESDLIQFVVGDGTDFIEILFYHIDVGSPIKKTGDADIIIAIDQKENEN